MSSDRRKPGAAPQKMVVRADGRYLRFSWRYDTWQVKTRTGAWVNVRTALAQAYAAAGFPIGVQ